MHFGQNPGPWHDWRMVMSFICVWKLLVHMLKFSVCRLTLQKERNFWSIYVVEFICKRDVTKCSYGFYLFALVFFSLFFFSFCLLARTVTIFSETIYFVSSWGCVDTFTVTNKVCFKNLKRSPMHLKNMTTFLSHVQNWRALLLLMFKLTWKTLLPCCFSWLPHTQPHPASFLHGGPASRRPWEETLDCW